MASAPDTESPSITAYASALGAFLSSGPGEPIASLAIGGLTCEVHADSQSVWIVARRSTEGGVALRAVYSVGEFECVLLEADNSGHVRLMVRNGLGDHEVVIQPGKDDPESIRITVNLTPRKSVLVPFAPRDLYAFGPRGNILAAKGKVEARQRGLNSGLIYFHFETPDIGSVLYFQNLTALNVYFNLTGTNPDSAVGGAWPELGFLLPTPDEMKRPLTDGLRGGLEVTLSDAILVFRQAPAPEERESARRFIQMVGTAYSMIERPAVEYRDWISRAERTLHDLDHAPEATIRHYGHRYIHPYTAAEYPDIMVQMSLIASLHSWGKWQKAPHPLESEFKAGLEKFYDPGLQSLRRYLPNVGTDKDADAIDSWYLYHPLLNLGILALDGDEYARKLLLKSLDFAIRVARHFKYKWPVQFNISDFSIITAVAGADGNGQTDVGGIYAWVMLQVFELTDDKRFLDEARNAIDAANGLRFNLNYQANLTAWGAAACIRLWRITNQRIYLEQSYVYIASFFHNSLIWESEIGLARHYSNFMGVTCLQDAPYMAIYECFESFAAFEHYLDDSGPDLEPAARMLVSEYCKYALSGAWFYYPDTLPPEAVSPKQRDTNGHIDRGLSFPLEDLYADGQLAGQVGQEVYGAGAAFIFATRAFHSVADAPFRIYCDHFVRSLEVFGSGVLSLMLHGGEGCFARLSVVRLKRRKLGKIAVSTASGEKIRPLFMSLDRIDFDLPASGRIVLTWT